MMCHELRRIVDRYLKARLDVRDELAYRKLLGDQLTLREQVILHALNTIVRLMMPPRSPVAKDVLQAAEEMRRD